MLDTFSPVLMVYYFIANIYIHPTHSMYYSCIFSCILDDPIFLALVHVIYPCNTKSQCPCKINPQVCTDIYLINSITVQYHAVPSESDRVEHSTNALTSAPKHLCNARRKVSECHIVLTAPRQTLALASLKDKNE